MDWVINRPSLHSQQQIIKPVWTHLEQNNTKSNAQHREARKKRSLKRENQELFIRDPFQFARQLFQHSKSGTLTVDREELETHLKKTYSDPTLEIPLKEITGLVWPVAPGIKFDSKPPSLQEVIAVVNKARAKSAPGPNVALSTVQKMPEHSQDATQNTTK
ncbi:reverse transcriptase [Plakobranchus ocellatus]|uniref:Reverse transcriptase n=1 Tax=Plakobranchus ocellatus TaxID=259542 RepID=A0AAV4CZX1_9GAST|nr:reverse transcriptase [Plakobranchus ocellatus]